VLFRSDLLWVRKNPRLMLDYYGRNLAFFEVN